MSTKYTGGFITKSPVAPTSTAASGVWTLDQQQQYQKAGTWPAPPIFIEDLFSTYLYTGNGSTQTITNGIDLSGQGGLTWLKRRDATSNHNLFDTVRGATKKLYSDLTNAEYTDATSLTSFNSNGFSLGLDGGGNANGGTYASWTFREQPKFFDIVTATNTGGTNARISHNLGSVPGFVIVKAINYSGESWRCYHRSIGINGTIQLNLTDATFTLSNYWGTSAPTATDFGINWTLFSGTNYIFYFFAHDAGGFPASGSGSNNAITCGSFTTAGSGGLLSAPVDLGYEPQWLLIKNTGSAENWKIYDTSRGMAYSGYRVLYPNLSNTEDSGTSAIVPTATGFSTPNASGPFANSATYIYIAIRRGPMKPPTTGTSVFTPVIYTGDNTSTKQLTSGFPIDLIIGGDRSSPPSNVFDRLRGVSSASPVSYTASTADEQSSVYGILGMTYLQTGDGAVRYQNSTGVNYVDWFFRRAPSFFDEVCYTGTGGQALTHNLGVTPELIFVKARSYSYNWIVYSATTGTTNILFLDLSNAVTAYTGFTSVTSNTFSPAGVADQSGEKFVAYLFATCPGVSKVGSYTGTAALLTVDCGFTSGARFVLIKRTDSTGGWYTYDSARGITSGNDPYLLLNSTAAEVTSTNYVDTDTTGFKVTAAAPAELNANGGTYIFLAIA